METVEADVGSQIVYANIFCEMRFDEIDRTCDALRQWPCPQVCARRQYMAMKGTSEQASLCRVCEGPPLRKAGAGLARNADDEFSHQRIDKTETLPQFGGARRPQCVPHLLEMYRINV